MNGGVLVLYLLLYRINFYEKLHNVHRHKFIKVWNRTDVYILS